MKIKMTKKNNDEQGLKMERERHAQKKRKWNRSSFQNEKRRQRRR